MARKTLLTLAALSLGIALALPAQAGPGGGNGNGPPDRSNPDDRPGRGGGNNGGGNGGGNGGPPATPPGLGGNQPPGHGGPNPGNGHGNGNGNGRGGGEVGRGGSRRVCEDSNAEVIGPLGQAGNSHVAHVGFSPEEGSESASWARMMYFWIGSSFDFNLNAHQIEPGSEWALIARADDGSAICLADGTANPGGQLHLRDSIELDSHLPDGLDPFAPTPTGGEPEGAALELVPADAVDCEAGSVAETAGGVLFSDNDIRFVDVDEVSCPE